MSLAPAIAQLAIVAMISLLLLFTATVIVARLLAGHLHGQFVATTSSSLAFGIRIVQQQLQTALHVAIAVVVLVMILKPRWDVLLIRVEVDDLLRLLSPNVRCSSLASSLSRLNSATAQLASVQRDVGQERYRCQSATEPRAIQRAGHLI